MSSRAELTGAPIHTSLLSEIAHCDEYIRALARQIIKKYKVNNPSATAERLVARLRDPGPLDDESVLRAAVASMAQFAHSDRHKRYRRVDRVRIVGQMVVGARAHTRSARSLPRARSGDPSQSLAESEPTGGHSSAILRPVGPAEIGRVGRYLDIGCGDGTITRSVGLCLQAREVIGVDIAPRPGAFLAGPNMTYAHDCRAISNASVDVVTAFVSLHHMGEALERTLAHVSRVMKYGGVLVLREHDYTYERTMWAFLALVHMLGDIEAHPERALCAQDIIDGARYRTMGEWDELLARHGLVR